MVPTFLSPHTSAPSRRHRSVGARVALLVFSVVLALVATVVDPVNAAKKTTKTTKAASGKKSSKAKAPRITLGDLRRTKAERDRIRAQAKQAAAKVNALKASQSQVSKQLDALNSTVRVTSVALDKAQRASASATAEAKQARRREKALSAKLVALQASSYKAALAAIAAPAVVGADSFLSSGTADEADRRSVIDSLGKRRTADVLDAMAATRDDLATERALADRAEKRAKSYQSAVTDKLTRYQAARSKQQKFAADVEARLEDQLAEAAAVASIDSKLAAQYQRQNDLLAAQLRAAGAGAGGRSSGSFTIPTIGEVGTGGGGDTHGIRVASSIRGKLAAMLAAANRDGVYLTGGGYRSSAQQIILRRAHCGSSSYAIYQAKASSCHPPTARPGFSQHERGLAIDFQYKGQSLNRSSPGYRWLRGNAARFGFFNLPSEPWHWSTTGR